MRQNAFTVKIQAWMPGSTFCQARLANSTWPIIDTFQHTKTQLDECSKNSSRPYYIDRRILCLALLQRAWRGVYERNMKIFQEPRVLFSLEKTNEDGIIYNSSQLSRENLRSCSSEFWLGHYSFNESWTWTPDYPGRATHAQQKEGTWENGPPARIISRREGIPDRFEIRSGSYHTLRISR